MKRIINQILPIILLAIAITAFALGILLFAYLFLFAAFIGLILFIISWIREKIAPPKPANPKTGRIIDSDDWKKL